MPQPIVPDTPFDTVGPFNYIFGKVQGLEGMNIAFKGVPLSLPAVVTAYVTVGAQAVYWKAGQLLQKDQRYMVTFGYLVRSDPGVAEETMAGFVDQFVSVMYQDPTMGGLVNNTVLEFAGADDPQYQGLAGQTIRRYPVVVMTQQQRNAKIAFALLS